MYCNLNVHDQDFLTLGVEAWNWMVSECVPVERFIARTMEIVFFQEYFGRNLITWTSFLLYIISILTAYLSNQLHK
jgi:hypothetical protein